MLIEIDRHAYYTTGFSQLDQLCFPTDVPSDGNTSFFHVGEVSSFLAFTVLQ